MGMRSKSYSELRRTLAATLDSVTDDHAPVLITRDRGKPAAVLMSLEDFTSWEETAYLLASPANEKALLASMAELEGGGGVELALDDLVAGRIPKPGGDGPAARGKRKVEAR